MLFNSIEYLVFLPIIFFLYWFIFNKNLQFQNTLLLISSYLFYGWWDWRFLSLIMFSTIVDYFVGLQIDNTKKLNHRKILLITSIIFNLTILGYFKYCNFFIDSWINFISLFGYQYKSYWSLKIVLPVGISFYTFQSMSYTIDIYKKNLKPTSDFIAFASFVAFFPQLVAGPIERASRLLPKILSKRSFNYKQGVEGFRLIIWGLFKKVIIADSLAWRVDYCFSNYSLLDGGSLILGLVYFSFQIYCDFSGYSDIAIGSAKLFGIELISNFRFPYFSRNIGEFWKRWHISLSSWFRDYVYFPLGGSKKGNLRTIRNIFLVFIISGLWHGANLTFIAWGFCHAVIYMIYFFYQLLQKITKGVNIAGSDDSPFIKKTIYSILTYSSVTFAWIFFRSHSIQDSFNYIMHIIEKFSFPLTNRSGILFIIPLIVLEWFMRNNERDFFITNKYFFNRILLCVMTLAIVIFFLNDYAYNKEMRQFVYFQF